MLIEQCQPLQHQQYGYEEMEYALQEHDYDTRGEGNSQMALLVIKQEVHVYFSSKQMYFSIYDFSQLKVLSPPLF